MERPPLVEAIGMHAVFACDRKERRARAQRQFDDSCAFPPAASGDAARVLWVLLLLPLTPHDGKHLRSIIVKDRPRAQDGL
jgi:hypothetical protein